MHLPNAGTVFHRLFYEQHSNETEVVVSRIQSEISQVMRHAIQDAEEQLGPDGKLVIGWLQDVSTEFIGLDLEGEESDA